MAYLLICSVIGFIGCGIWAMCENKRIKPVDGKPIVPYVSTPSEESPKEEPPVVKKPRAKKDPETTPKGPRKPKMTVVK